MTLPLAPPTRLRSVNRSRTSLVLLVAAGLLVAACGGDDQDSSASATTQNPGSEAGSTISTEATDGPTGSTEAPVDSGGLDQSAIDAAAADFLDGQSAQGVTAFYVGIVDPDAGEFVSAYGDASVDGPAATVDDSFRIGSVSKSATATVILQLVDSGDLSLDDTVAELTPELATTHPEIETVTVEQLLNMTSGISDYLNNVDVVAPDVVADPTKVWTADELIAAGIEAGVAEPGTAGYSSTNYIILQVIAETVTGSSLQDLIVETVSGPLGLDTLSLPSNEDTALPDPATHGYVDGACVDELAADGAAVEPGTDTTDWNVSFTQGAGGMTSTIADLLGWASSGSGSSLLDDATAAQRAATPELLPEGVPYGLGIIDFGGWLGHSGEAIGWEALAIQNPETGAAIAVAGNGCGGLFTGFLEFVGALYPEQFG